MNFSEKLNQYIELLDCSAKDICDISGLSPTIVSRYINGKRTPRIQSEYFDKIVDSIYKLSIAKNIKISKDDIYKSFEKSLVSTDINYDDFISNLNTLIIELKINTNDFAKYLGYDASFISKLRSKSRKPADLNSFINSVSSYIVDNFKSFEKKKQVSEIMQCIENDINNVDNYKLIVNNWLVKKQTNQNKQIENFLYALDNFDLNNYVGTDFTKVKVPSSPIILRSNKIFYGKERKKNCRS